LTKTGAGTKALTAANSYSGARRSAAGILEAGAGGSAESASAFGTGRVTVNGGTVSLGTSTRRRGQYTFQCLYAQWRFAFGSKRGPGHYCFRRPDRRQRRRHVGHKLLRLLSPPEWQHHEPAISPLDPAGSPLFLVALLPMLISIMAARPRPTAIPARSL